MALIDRVLNRFGLASIASVKAELQELQKWQTDTADAQRYSIPEGLQFARLDDMYRLSPLVGTALSFFGNDVGAFADEFEVKKYVGEKERAIANHPFEHLLKNPNPLQTGFELMRDSAIDYKLNGNFVWWLNKTGEYDAPSEIWQMPYHMIKPIPDERMYLAGYSYDAGNGKPLFIPTWQIMHVKEYNPFNRFYGLSPMESLRDTISSDSGMRYTSKVQYVDHRGEPPSILAFKDVVNNEAWTETQAKVKNAALKDEMLMLRGVGDGVTWLSRAMSSRDMEYTARLKQNVEDVFNRLTPGLLSMLDGNSTYSNAASARNTYNEKTLWVFLKMLSGKLSSDILPSYTNTLNNTTLTGEFEDPRERDRKLELDEQNSYAMVHTIAEVRAEFYEDDPLGDERDNLFASQINAQAGDGTKQAQPPQLQQPPQDTLSQQAQPTGGETGNSNPQTQSQVSMKAVEDLRKWKKIALKGNTEKAQAFTSDFIPAITMQDITAKLNGATPETIAAVFDEKIERYKPQDTLTAGDILRALELVVRKAEA